MIISTRTRYGARLMLQLALEYGNGYCLLKDIAKKEDISEKYLSLIVMPLKAKGLLVSGRGAKGGYMLAKKPSLISMRDIIVALESEMPADYLSKKIERPRDSISAVTRDVWKLLDERIQETLGAISLEELVEKYKRSKNSSPNYEI